MSNRLSMSKIHSIETLHQSGHSNREIARLLGVDRGTMNAYVRRLKSQNRPDPQMAEPGLAEVSVEEQSGSETGSDENQPDPQTGSSDPVVNQPEFPPARSGPRSLCDGYREQIEQKLEAGLSIQRILQDLKGDGFEGSYHSVRRFVVSLGKKTPLPFRRMETAPGEEAQIDFGMAAPVVMADGKKRRPWLFRVVLSCSRKAYSEVVWHQTSDNFIAAIENSFHYFGGVPKTLVIDNLKAAVNRADWYDPDVHPKLQSFAAHYRTVFVPTKPYTPEHKGKVESSVKYAKNNALKGHSAVAHDWWTPGFGIMR